jgi:hypothetical protein
MVIFFSVSGICYSQTNDSLNLPSAINNPLVNSSMHKYNKPEIFSSGFIDILNNGQVNASARLIRLFIGEPGKFSIPISVYSGVSSNNFQSLPVNSIGNSNDQLITGLINPLGGLVNFSMEDIIFFRKMKHTLTGSGILYHSGMRLMTGYEHTLPGDPQPPRPVNFVNLLGTGGVYFQTGAWDRNNARNVGICWLAGRYIISKSPAPIFEKFFQSNSNGFYEGWSAGWGIQINYLLDIKLVFYKYLKAPVPGNNDPIYQFSFTYSMK